VNEEKLIDSHLAGYTTAAYKNHRTDVDIVDATIQFSAVVNARLYGPLAVANQVAALSRSFTSFSYDQASNF